MAERGLNNAALVDRLAAANNLARDADAVHDPNADAEIGEY